MKICAVICEFNPFHNGHRYLLERVKATGRFDGVLCIMSGHFTQRGDRAITDKFTRSGHAVMGGADCVVELPAPFATAPAQVFARGAIKLLSSIPEVCALAFGCEGGADFAAAAKAAAAESGQFKKVLKDRLAAGESYAKSYSAALENVSGQSICTPNNILAFEYAAAIAEYRSDIELLPFTRQGAGYSDRQLDGEYASASGIRAHLGDDAAARYVPDFVAQTLRRDDVAEARWEAVVKYALQRATAEELKGVYGCGEGLANALKKLQNLPLEDIIAAGTCRRYPSARIRRALTANALLFTAEKTAGWLANAGYIKPLAVRADVADDMLRALALSRYPMVITGSDAGALRGADGELYAAGRFADGVWENVSGTDVYDYTLLKI